MATYSIRGADGRTGTIEGPPDLTDAQLDAMLQAQFGDTVFAVRQPPAPAAPAEEGTLARMGRTALESTGHFLSDTAQGVADAFRSSDMLNRDVGQRVVDAQAKAAQESLKHPPQRTVSEAYRQEGVPGALQQVVKNAPTAVAEAVGPVGAGLIAAGLTSGYGTVPSLLAAGAVTLPSIFKQFNDQQAQAQLEQNPQGPVDIDRLKSGTAATAAATVMGLVQKIPGLAALPGASNYLRVLSNEAAPATAKAAASAALEKMAADAVAKGTLRTLATGAAKGAAVDPLLMAANAALGRAQAGQDLTGTQAENAYIDAAAGFVAPGALLGAHNAMRSRTAAQQYGKAGSDYTQAQDAQQRAVAQQEALQAQQIAEAHPEFIPRLQQRYQEFLNREAQGAAQYQSAVDAFGGKAPDPQTDPAGAIAYKNAVEALENFKKNSRTAPQDVDLIHEYARNYQRIQAYKAQQEQLAQARATQQEMQYFDALTHPDTIPALEERLKQAQAARDAAVQQAVEAGKAGDTAQVQVQLEQRRQIDQHIKDTQDFLAQAREAAALPEDTTSGVAGAPPGTTSRYTAETPATPKQIEALQKQLVNLETSMAAVLSEPQAQEARVQAAISAYQSKKALLDVAQASVQSAQELKERALQGPPHQKYLGDPEEIAQQGPHPAPEGYTESLGTPEAAAVGPQRGRNPDWVQLNSGTGYAPTREQLLQQLYVGRATRDRRLVAETVDLLRQRNEAPPTAAQGSAEGKVLQDVTGSAVPASTQANHFQAVDRALADFVRASARPRNTTGYLGGKQTALESVTQAMRRAVENTLHRELTPQEAFDIEKRVNTHVPDLGHKLWVSRSPKATLDSAREGLIDTFNRAIQEGYEKTMGPRVAPPLEPMEKLPLSVKTETPPPVQVHERADLDRLVTNSRVVSHEKAREVEAKAGNLSGYVTEALRAGDPRAIEKVLSRIEALSDKDSATGVDGLQAQAQKWRAIADATRERLDAARAEGADETTVKSLAANLQAERKSAQQAKEVASRARAELRTLRKVAEMVMADTTKARDIAARIKVIDGQKDEKGSIRFHEAQAERATTLATADKHVQAAEALREEREKLTRALARSAPGRAEVVENGGRTTPAKATPAQRGVFDSVKEAYLEFREAQRFYLHTKEAHAKNPQHVSAADVHEALVQRNRMKAALDAQYPDRGRTGPAMRKISGAPATLRTGDESTAEARTTNPRNPVTEARVERKRGQDDETANVTAEALREPRPTASSSSVLRKVAQRAGTGKALGHYASVLAARLEHLQDTGTFPTKKVTYEALGDFAGSLAESHPDPYVRKAALKLAEAAFKKHAGTLGAEKEQYIADKKDQYTHAIDDLYYDPDGDINPRLRKEGGNTGKPLDAAVVAHLENGRLNSALRELATNPNTDAVVRRIANKLADWVGRDIPAELVDTIPESDTATGAYRPNKAVQLHRQQGLDENTLLHESAHPVIQRILEAPEHRLMPKQIAAKRALEQMMRGAKAAIDRGELDNAVIRDGDIQEFVAEGLGSAKVRDWMAQNQRNAVPETLWSRFKTAVLNLLGVPTPPKGPQLGHFLDAAEVMFATPYSRVENLVRAGGVRLRAKADTYNAAGMQLAEAGGKFIRKDPETLKDAWEHRSAIPLALHQSFVDHRSAVQKALQKAAEKGDVGAARTAQAAMLSLDASNRIAGTVMEHGALSLVKRDGMEWLESTGHPAADHFFQALDAIPLPSPAARDAAFQTHMSVLRGFQLGSDRLGVSREGWEHMVQADRAAMADPAMSAALNRAQDAFNAFNKPILKSMHEVGAITTELYEKLAADKNYVPWLREGVDGAIDIMAGDGTPIASGDFRTMPWLETLKGSDLKVLPIREATGLIATIQTEKALQNFATRSVGRVLETFGKEATTPVMQVHTVDDPSQVPKGHQHGDVISWGEGDKTHWMRIDTRGTAIEGIPTNLLVQAVAGRLGILPKTFLGKFGLFTGGMLRAAVTRNPVYLVSQLIKDPLAQSIQGNVASNPLSAVLKTMYNFGAILNKSSKSYDILARHGALNSQIYHGDARDFTNLMRAYKGEGANPYRKTLDFLDRVAHASDSATRVQAFDDAIKAGATELEAAIHAQEIQNFHRKGAGALAQGLGTFVPFSVAQISGLNTYVRAARGNMPLEAKLAIKNKFYTRALALGALNAAHLISMEDDEDWRKLPLSKKLMYMPWRVDKDTTLLLPSPFEAGFAVHALPVALLEHLRGGVHDENVWKAFVKAASTNILPNMTPPVVNAAVGLQTNYNMVLDSKITPNSQSKLSAAYQYSNSNTQLERAVAAAIRAAAPPGMGDTLNAHDIKFISNALFGQFPAMLGELVDVLFEPKVSGVLPSRKLSDIGVLRRFSTHADATATANIEDAYMAATHAMEAQANYNKLRAEGKPAEARAVLREGLETYGPSNAATAFTKRLAVLRARYGQLERGQVPGRTPDEVRSEMTSIARQMDATAANYLRLVPKQRG